MISFETLIRVRYGETDKMGVVYYGHYPLYYETGRTELMRSLGISYKEIEQQGVIMPVLSLKLKYLRPAYYDDLLTVRTMIRDLPAARITFFYEIFNEQKEKINEGTTELAFVDLHTGKPKRAPEKLIAILKRKL